MILVNQYDSQISSAAAFCKFLNVNMILKLGYCLFGWGQFMLHVLELWLMLGQLVP